MKNFVGFTLGCLFAFLSSGITPLMAQDAAVNELVITRSEEHTSELQSPS